MSTVQKKRRQYRSGSVFQRKDGMWVGRFGVGKDSSGRRRTITVYATSEQACKERLEERKQQVARSGVPEKGSGRNITVEQWSAQWLDVVVTELRPSAYRASASAVRVWINPTIGHKRLVDLVPADVRSVFDALRKAGRSQATRIRVHSDLMQLLKAAKLEGHDVLERVYLVKKPKPGESDREAIPGDDAIAILGVIAEGDDVAMWTGVLLQGLRQGERLGLTWDCVDFINDTIDISWQLQPLPYIDNKDKSLGFRVPDGYRVRHLVRAFHLVRPKSKKGQRKIPMVPWMRSALLTHQQTSAPNDYGLIWADDQGQPRKADDDRARWREIQELADVQHPAGRRYVLHEGRHATVTLLLDLGVDKDTVEAIVGQSKLIDAYDHSDRLPRMRVALEKLADRLALTT